MSAPTNFSAQTLQDILENEPWIGYFKKHSLTMASKRIASPRSTTTPSHCNLLAFSDSRVFFWNSVENSVVTGMLHSAEQHRVGMIDCDVDPLAEVDNIIPSPGGCSLALIGNRGISVLDVGSDELASDSSRRIGRCIAISERFFLNNPKITVLQFQWLPLRETHILFLTSDNCLRVFKISKPTQPEVVISLHGSTTKRCLHNFSSFTAIIDDIPSYPSTSSPSDYSVTSFVIYAVRSDGNVYTCDLSVGNERTIASNVRGPLNPEAPFGTDMSQLATSILYINAVLPVLAVATNSGKVFHGILLEKEDVEMEDDSSPESSIPKQSELIFIERFELSSSNAKGFANKNRVASTLLSHKDFPSCYVLSTDLQLVGVSLPWLNDLDLLLDGQIGPDSLRSTTVQCVISLDPFDKAHEIRLLGARLIPTDAHECSLLTVASNGQVAIQRLMGKGQISDRSSLQDLNTTSDLPSRIKPSNEAPFTDLIESLLRRDSSLPVFTFTDEDKVTAEDLAPLLRKGVAVFEEQYLSKQRQAYEEILSRKQRLESRKKHVSQIIDSTEQSVKELENAHFDFLNENDLLEMEGTSLQDRITYLQEEFARYNPTATDAERQLEDNLHELAEKIDKLQELVEVVEQKLAYKERLPVSSSGSIDQEAEVEIQLNAEIARIVSLKRRIALLKTKCEA